MPDEIGWGHGYMGSFSDYQFLTDIREVVTFDYQEQKDKFIADIIKGRDFSKAGNPDSSDPIS